MRVRVRVRSSQPRRATHGPFVSSAQTGLKNSEALAAMMARLMKKEKRRAAAASMREYQMAA